MDARQTFKHAVISGLIEAGVTTPREMCGVVKRAVDKVAGYPGEGVLNAAADFGKTLGGWGLAGAMAAPPLIGAGLGTLAAKANDVGDLDAGTDEAKRQEVIDEYHRQSARLRREGLLRRYAQSPGGRPSGPLL